MAGIGFVLRRLTRRDDLSGALQAFTAAAAVTSGPWLLTVLAIAGSGLGDALANSPPEYQTFRVMLSYDFCFSLVLTAPATTLAARLVADQLFAGDVDAIVPTFLATLAVALLTQMPLVILFWLVPVDVGWAAAAAAIACYAALVALWVTTAFLSVLRDFGFVLLCFLSGMIVACGGSLLAGQVFGTAGMLTCFACGIAVVAFAGTGRLVLRFPYGPLHLNALLQAAKRNRTLLLIGLLTAAAPWADKWIMWFGPSSERMASGLHHAPSYDSAMFLAYLAMVPGSAAFFVIAETGFFLSYRRFFDEILSGAGLSRIESQRQELALDSGQAHPAWQASHVAISRAPNDAATLLLAAQSSASVRRSSEAAALYTRLLALGPQDAAVMIDAGDALLMAKQVEAGRRVLTEALRRLPAEPATSAAARQRARALMLLKRPDEAVTLLTVWLTRSPTDAGLQADLLQARLDGGDLNR